MKEKTTITETLAQGYKLAKTPEQVEKVKYYHSEVKKRIARMHRLLDEIIETNPFKK